MDLAAMTRLYHRALPLLCASTSLEAAALPATGDCVFPADWHGEPLVRSVRFLIALDPDDLHLCFAATEKPDCDGSLRPGDFVEGLWERDVAELFLVEDGTGRYQEFNLSPVGAWWTALFTGHRARAQEDWARPTGVRVFASTHGSGWRAGLSIPRTSLAVRLAFDEGSRANVTAVVGGQERRFLSWGPPCAGTPDFHRDETRVPFAPY